MRKILSLILAIALCFSIGTMVGCGGDDNYESASAQELLQIAELMEENKGDSPATLGVEGGYKLSTTMSGEEGGVTLSTKIDATVVKVEDTYEIAISIDGGADGGVNTYYKDGYLYTRAVINGQVYTSKMSGTVNEAFANLYENLGEMVLELDDAIEEMSMYGDALKCYIDKSGENTKVKVEVKMSEAGMNIEMVINYEIDANYKLISYGYDMDMGSIKMNCSLNPYSGTITFPADLDAYVGQ